MGQIDARVGWNAEIKTQWKSRLLQLPPELGGSAGGHAVSEVEDWGYVSRTIRTRLEPIPLVSIALTLLDAILLGALEILILLLAGDALNALIVVVLVGSADGGVGAL